MYWLTLWSHPLTRVINPGDISNSSCYIPQDLSGQPWKEVALSCYHGAHTGLEAIESEANTTEQMAAGCLTECPSRVTTGVACGPGLARMPWKGHCFSDSPRINKTQHIFYDYIFAVFNLVFLASSFPISWSQVWGINLLYAPSLPVLCLIYFPIFLFFFSF